MAAMTHLDTHVVVWLYAGEIGRFPETARKVLDRDLLLISPAVALEVQYLHEIGRITKTARVVIEDLRDRMGLSYAEADFAAVVSKALTLSWTRDPFDRLIVAHALADDARLLTADKVMRKHVRHAFWDR
jgi:PIN domain nuclease of toxin-antitoxin system